MGMKWSVGFGQGNDVQAFLLNTPENVHKVLKWEDLGIEE